MRAITAILFATIVLSPSLLQAETLAMPDDGYSQEIELDASQMGPAVATPRKGDSMQSVTRKFGQPVKKYRTVGGSSKRQPPITRWDYDQFYVFFEHTHVVDAVVPGRPPKLERMDGLKKVSQ